MQTKPKCGLYANALLKEYDLIGLCVKGVKRGFTEILSFCLMRQFLLLPCVPLVAHGWRLSVINANQKVLVILTGMVTGILCDTTYVKH